MTHPEYRLTLRWRSDQDGNGIRTLLEHAGVDGKFKPLTASFIPTLDLLEAVERTLTAFFTEEHKP